MPALLTRRQLGALGVAYGAGAASARAQTPKPPKLVVIVSDTFTAPLDRFSKQWTQHTGVPVEIISQAYDQTYTKVVTALAGGSPVDIVIVDSIWTAAFAKAGFLRPLDQDVGPIEDQLMKVAIDQRKVNGHIYSMPATNEGKFLYYNEDILTRGGYSAPPKTWEELIQVSRDLQKKGIAKYGTVWAWQQAEGLICDYTLLTADLKGTIRSEDGQWRFNEGGGLEALKFMVSQLKDGIADPASLSLNDRQIVDSFDGGNAAFMLSWSFALSVANNASSSPIAGKVKMGLVPGFASAGTVSSTVTGGSGLGITTASKAPDWAWDLVKYATDPERQIEMLSIRSNMPVWKALYDNPVVAKTFPYVKAMETQFDYATWRPNFPGYAQASTAMQVNIHAALSGRKTPEQALNDAVSQVKTIR